MKSTKKVVSLLLAVIMVVGMLAGCSGKEKDPKELFVNAFDKYHNAVEENKVVKLLQESLAGGSVGVKMESGEGEDKQLVDATVYLNEAGKAGGLALNMDMEGYQFDVQLALDQKNVILGSSVFKEKYGIDLEKVKENLPKSLFGSQGENLFQLDEESEKELFEMLDELNAELKKEHKKVDAYQVLMNALTENGTFTADTKTPVKIDGKDVKNTTVTVTFTKDNMKSIVNKLVAELELQPVVDRMIETMNEEAAWDAEWEGTEPKVYENMNDVLDEAFEGKEGEDVVFTMKLVLDAKHDAIMIMELTAEETITVEFGADPANITQVVITYPTEEMPVDSTKPITKMEKLILKINKSATSTEYELLDENQNGLKLVINKAHQEITFAEMEEGKVNSDDAYSCKYSLTDTQLSLTMVDDGDEYSDPSTITITLTANVESPIKFDNYIDLLTMNKKQFEDMVQDIYDFLGMEDEFEFDDIFGEKEPEYDTDLPMNTEDEVEA